MNQKTDTIQEEMQSLNLNSSLDTRLLMHVMLTGLEYEYNKRQLIFSYTSHLLIHFVVSDEADQIDEVSDSETTRLRFFACFLRTDKDIEETNEEMNLSKR